MDLFLVVFEDNQLELVDADLIFNEAEHAESVKETYRRSFYSGANDRKLVVRRMKTITMQKVNREILMSARPLFNKG